MIDMAKKKGFKPRKDLTKKAKRKKETNKTNKKQLVNMLLHSPTRSVYAKGLFYMKMTCISIISKKCNIIVIAYIIDYFYNI